MTNMMDLYQKKYCILKRKCEELHQTNEKLVNRLHHVKRILKRYKQERRMLVGELDSYSDDFREADIPPVYEDGEVSGEQVLEQMMGQAAAAGTLIPKQEPVPMVSSEVTVDTDTNPSSSSTSSTTRAAPLGR